MSRRNLDPAARSPDGGARAPGGARASLRPGGSDARSLTGIVRAVRRRWRLRLALRGATIVGAIAIAVVVLGAWGLERAGFSAGALLTLRTASYAALALALWHWLFRPLARRTTDEQVALYLEEHEPALQELVVSGLELERSGALDPFARRTIERALERCAAMGDGHTIERPQLRRFAGTFATVALVALVLGAFRPGFLRDGAGALLNPLADAAAAARYAILVEPGSVTLPRGADQAIRARLRGFEAQDAELVLRAGADSSFQRIAMYAVGDSTGYEVMLFGVAAGTEYFVEAGGVRSAVYRLDVSDLPYVERIDLEYEFPAYTGREPERVEDGGDVVVLRGTTVHVEARTTVPAAAGTLVLSDGRRIEMSLDSAGVLAGAFRVDAAGFYRLELGTATGETLNGSPQYTIDVLDDRAPSVRFTKPGRDHRPTSVDEVFLEVQAEDDHGVRAIDLVYAVNGTDPRTLQLFRSGAGLTEVAAGHTLYLEELELRPGDVISYFARARDHAGVSREVTSDIYFLTIRPFGREYRQAESGPPPEGGGGGAGENPGELSQQQREIIAATFNLGRDSAQYSPERFREHLNTITLMQSRLRDQVRALAERMNNRQITQDTIFARIAALLPEAAAVMDTVLTALRTRGPAGALQPEQRALLPLLRAEALYREVQVALQQQPGAGGGGAPNAEDLADLFELELDKLRNQYETVQRGEREQAQAQVDETLEKLRELARRLQQENERARRQALQGQASGSGGGNATQRQLAEEIEQAARQLERLSRERQQSPELERAARELERAADAMRQAAADARNGNTANAREALERLREAQRRLEGDRGASMQREAGEALRRAERLAEQQRRTGEELERFARGDQRTRERAQELIDRRTRELAETQSIEQEMDRLAAGTSREQRDASRRLQEAANTVRRTQLKERQSYSRDQLTRNATPDQVRGNEQRIVAGMDSVLDQLRRAASAFRPGAGDADAQALERARDLARGLESMRERTRNAQRAGEGEPGGVADGQADGAAPSDGGRAGAVPDAGRAGAAPSDGGRAGSAPSGDGRAQPGLSGEQTRQLRGEARERLREAEALRRELSRQGRDVAPLDDVIRGLRQLESEGTYASGEQLQRIQADVAERMKAFEFALTRALLGESREKLFLTGSDDVPEGFRALVEEYYRRLGARP
ncbi:MAG TPA: hypothetical protein VK939_17955 [Longimicrobiales bacterium]|nr:hypothetical protein [Longimicrobiales bacterium]